MKIIFGLILLLSLNTFAKTIEFGTYEAIDVDSGTIKATMLMKADGTVNFKLSAPDFEMPEPGCNGTFQVVENTLLADMTCPLEMLPHAFVQINIKDVTPESVRAADGVVVPVIIDALGEEPNMFKLKIIESAAKAK